MEVVVANNLLTGHEDVTDANPSQVSDMEAIEALTSTHSSGLSIPSPISEASSVFGVFTRSSDLTDGSDDLSLRGPNSTFESETGGLSNQIPLVVTTSYDDDMLLEEIRKSKKESEVDLNVAQIQDTKDTEANDNVVPSNLEATSQLVSEKRKVPTKARSPDLSRRPIAKPGKQSTLRTLVTAASDLVNSAVTDQSKHSESAETEPSNFIAKSVTEEKKIMNDVVQPTLSLQKAANEKTTKSKQFADSLSLALQSIEPVERSTRSEASSDNTPIIKLQRVESNPVPSSNPKSAVSKVKFLSKASSPVELSKMGLHRSGSLGSLQFSQRSSVTKSSRSQSVILGPHPNPFADRSNSLKKPQQIESKTNSDASLISISKAISMAVEGKARNRVEVLENGGGRDSSGKSQIQPTMTEFRLQSLKVLLSTSQQPSKIPVSKRSSSSDNHKSANEFEYLSTSNSIGLPVSGQTSNALLPSPNSSSAHSTASRSGIPKRTSLAVINSTGGVSLSNYKPSSSSRLGSLGSSHFLPRRQSAISGIAMGESAYLPIDPSVTGSPTNRHGRSPSGNGRETQFSIRPTVNAQNSVATKSQNRRLSGVHGTSSSPTPLQFGELVNEHKSRPRGKAVRGPRKFSLEWIKDKFSFSRKTVAM
ncbi:hypothetical protein HDU79_003049 [Rhizoclosmatium sp. JEL0117]|nr:hypothetical protein HDU79_003049 [Rhizoclosmatium sp. JEL0117]